MKATSKKNPQQIRTVGLPLARHEQLQRLAFHRQCSMADVIGQFISQAMQTGEIKDETPGIEITRSQPSTSLFDSHKTISIKFDGHTAHLHTHSALGIADSLERLASTPGNPVIDKTAEFRDTLRQLRDIGINVEPVAVRRQGMAIVLSTHDGKRAVTLSASVARDVARQLKAVATETESQT